MSSYPNILERACVGAKMAVAAAESNFLCTTENQDEELILRNIFLQLSETINKACYYI